VSRREGYRGGFYFRYLIERRSCPCVIQKMGNISMRLMWLTLVREPSKRISFPATGTITEPPFFSHNHPFSLFLPDLTGDDSVIMLTTTRILLIRSTKLRVIWEVPFDDITTISLEPSGIQLVLDGGMGGPFLPLPEMSQRMFLFKHVEK
jgi:hypothetical protein